MFASVEGPVNMSLPKFINRHGLRGWRSSSGWSYFNGRIARHYSSFVRLSVLSSSRPAPRSLPWLPKGTPAPADKTREAERGTILEKVPTAKS